MLTVLTKMFKQDKNRDLCQTYCIFRVSKTRKHDQHAWGRFWIAWGNLGQNVTLFCRILQVVANYAVLTVHMNKQARLYCFF